MRNLLQAIPPLSTFPSHVERHLAVVAKTREIEQQAQEVIAANFAQPLLDEFIRCVHIWGGSVRNLDQVIASAEPEHFIAAWNALNQPRPMPESALNHLLRVSHLGTSYGSKLLRFLRPDICPVLDSFVGAALDLRRQDAKEYRILQLQVMGVVKALEQNRIPNPMNRPNGCWYAADVDMAFFAHLQIKTGRPGWGDPILVAKNEETA